MTCNARNINYLLRIIEMSLKPPSCIQDETIDASILETIEISSDEDSLPDGIVASESFSRTLPSPGGCMVDAHGAKRANQPDNTDSPQPTSRVVDIPSKSKRKKISVALPAAKRRKENSVVCAFPSCSERFGCIDAMELHRAIHLVGHRAQYECYLCKKSLTMKRYLLCHMERYHTRKVAPQSFRVLEDSAYPVRCTQHPCIDRFESHDAMQHHIQTYHKQDKKTFECHICKKQVRSNSAMKTHMVVKHEAKKPYICSIAECGKRFSQPHAAKAHVARVHSKPRLKCLISGCTDRFIHIDDVKSHVLKVHPDHMNTIRSFHCYLCKRTYSNALTLRKHFKRMHVNKLLKCPKCPKMNKGASTLKRHLAYKHGQGHVHQCDLCQKILTSSFSLKTHMLMHAGERQFRCPNTKCTMSFRRGVHLNDHMVKEHGEQHMPYCPVCRQMMESNDALNSHMQEKHGGNKCLIAGCSKKFPWKALLIDHMAHVHGQGSKPICHFCQKSFATRYTLRDHVKQRCPARMEQNH